MTGEVVLTLRMKQLRTKQMLVQAPDLVAYMLSLVSPGAGSGGGEGRVGGTKEIPLPLNAQALDDANGLYAQLVNYAISHARALGVMPPSIAMGWARRDVDCDGFPSWALIEDATALTFDICDWLVLGGDRIAGLPTAGNYFTDVAEMMRPLLGRYQRAPRHRTTSTETCDTCGQRTVVVNFTDDGDDATVACTYCGYVVPPAAYERYLAQVLVVLAKEEPGSDRAWWTLEEAAEFGDVHPKTVRRYVADGLPVHRGGLVKREDFLTWKRGRVAAAIASRFQRQETAS